VPLLVPGIGAQGGDLAATVRAGWCRSEFPGLILNSSRAILYASEGEDWQDATAAAAQSVHAAVRAVLADRA
jgi:orotidine-5'-phosphate decarboxylase